MLKHPPWCECELWGVNVKLKESPPFLLALCNQLPHKGACDTSLSTTRHSGLVLQHMRVWSYEGGADGSEEAKQRGEQRATAGMLCFEDAMGECKLVGKNGDDLLCAFREAGATVQRTCVAALVRVLAPTKPLTAPQLAAKRRHGAQQQTLFSLQGKETPPDKPKQKLVHGLGTSTLGKRPAAGRN